MESAFELFSSKGYDKVSLNEVIEKAGVSKGGLFHYFDSKYTLARETLMWFAQSHMEPGFFESVSEDMEPRDMLIHFIDFMISMMENEDWFTKFFWSIFDESMKREEDSRLWIDFLEQYAQMVAEIYRGMGVKDPEMKDEAKETAKSFFDAIGATFTELGDEFKKWRNKDDDMEPPSRTDAAPAEPTEPSEEE